MILMWLALLLAATELATYLWLRARICWQRYPALMASLLLEAACHIGGAFCYPIDTRWSQPLRMAARVWVAAEVFYFACIRLSFWQRARLTGEAVTISGTAAWLVAIWTRLTPLENFFIFRGYFHLTLAVAVAWTAVYVRRAMVMENQDHRAYRAGVTRWFAIVALGGLFVKGGGGYWISCLTDAEGDIVWQWVRGVGLALLILNTIWTGWRMASNVSCLRPDVAYGSIAKAFGEES